MSARDGTGGAGWSRGHARWAASVCLVAAAVVVGYWAVWFTDRGVLASSTGAAYVQFEDAFPLADAWLTVCLVVAAVACLRGHARRARVWLLAAASSGLYLLGMDALYDMEHGIWVDGGAAGVVEGVINALTLMLSVVLWWLSSRAATASADRVTEM